MQQRRRHYSMAALLVTFFLALLLVSCAGPVQESIATAEVREVAFETIDLSDYASYTGNHWPVAAPGIAIIAEPADIEQLGAFITPDSQAKLRALNFETDFALAAFLDSQGCYESEWGIGQILMRDGEMEVFATYPPYDPERGCALDFVLPYQVIRLPREGVWGKVTRFTLYINGEHAVSGTYPPVVNQATPVPRPQPEITPYPSFTPGPTQTPAATPLPALPYPPPSSAEQTAVAGLATAALQGYPVPPAEDEPTPEHQPKLIAGGQVTGFRWSDDSQLIYYFTKGQGIFVYELVGGGSRPAEPPPTATTTPLLPNLPALTDFGLAPSGDRLLYVVRLSPTATPLPPASPEAMGEGPGDSDPGQLWLADSNGQQLIGELEDCVSDFLWSEDETRVVITAIPPPTVCEESWAWFVDLQQHTITNLFPRRQHTELRGFALSPSGRQLLFYGVDVPGLHLLDLDEGITRTLDIPGGAGGTWLNESNLLVRFRLESDMRAGLYNLQTNELKELVGPIATPLLEGKVVQNLTISPDRHWLAFASGDRLYEMEFLWLLELPQEGS